MGSNLHEGAITAVRNWGLQQVAVAIPQLEVDSGELLLDQEDGQTSTKPDVIFPYRERPLSLGSSHPVVALEVGFSQTLASLKAAATR